MYVCIFNVQVEQKGHNIKIRRIGWTVIHIINPPFDDGARETKNGCHPINLEFLRRLKFLNKYDLHLFWQ